MSFVHDVIANPDVIEGEAVVASMLPEPGPLVAAVLRMLETAIRDKKQAAEIDAITAKFSTEAQVVADGWK